MRDRYPKPRREPEPELEARFQILQRFVVAVRQLRANSDIKDSERLVVVVKAVSPATQPMLEQAKEAVKFLAKLDHVDFVQAREKGWAAQYDADFEAYVDLSKKYIDIEVELARLDKAIDKTKAEIEAADKTLSNPNFVAKAPAEKVQGVRDRKADAETRLRNLEVTRAELAG